MLHICNVIYYHVFSWVMACCYKHSAEINVRLPYACDKVCDIFMHCINMSHKVLELLYATKKRTSEVQINSPKLLLSSCHEPYNVTHLFGILNIWDFSILFLIIKSRPGRGHWLTYILITDKEEIVWFNK